nr:MAG: hypothetical protein [Bacteriophage sp.]
MTIEEAQAIIAKMNSPHLKRDMEKFIKRQQRKEGWKWHGPEGHKRK